MLQQPGTSATRGCLLQHARRPGGCTLDPEPDLSGQSSSDAGLCTHAAPEAGRAHCRMRSACRTCPCCSAAACHDESGGTPRGRPRSTQKKCAGGWSSQARTNPGCACAAWLWRCQRVGRMLKPTARASLPPAGRWAWGRWTRCQPRRAARWSWQLAVTGQAVRTVQA